MLADRNAFNARLSSVFAREFCPLCIADDESTQESSTVRSDAWCCPECRGPVENPEDILCLACLTGAYSFRSFAAE
jgi:hypothetical protein